MQLFHLYHGFNAFMPFFGKCGISMLLCLFYMGCERDHSRFAGVDY